MGWEPAPDPFKRRGQREADDKSILVGGDDLATIERNQTAKRDDVDRVFEETDAAITHQNVDAAGTERRKLIVIAGIVALGDERTCREPGRRFVIGTILVVWLAGNTIVLVGL